MFPQTNDLIGTAWYRHRRTIDLVNDRIAVLTERWATDERQYAVGCMEPNVTL